MNEPLLQVQSEVNGTTHIDIEEIRNFTNGLIYPLYFLDFETIGPAVPKYNGSRPYQQLVFQYSLHIQETLTSVIEHREYLADPTKDPRIGFIEQLIQDCGSSGDIIVYKSGFERGKIGPVDNNDFIGGNYISALNLSTDLPFLLPTVETVDFSLFVDAANVWGVDYDSTIDDKSFIRSSTGIGMNVLTPVGPLSFSLSKPITKKSSDKTETFRFNLGTTF